MCGMSSPDRPDVPPPPPVQPEAPDASRRERVSKDPDDERRRRAAMGRSGTILTGPRGVENGTGTVLGA